MVAGSSNGIGLGSILCTGATGWQVLSSRRTVRARCHSTGERGVTPRQSRRFMEVEIEAHPDLTDLSVSTVQIDNRGYTVWLAKRA